VLKQRGSRYAVGVLAAENKRAEAVLPMYNRQEEHRLAKANPLGRQALGGDANGWCSARSMSVQRCAQGPGRPRSELYGCIPTVR